ncbi:hypothetical protein FHG87_014680 [Trinorchestia longiramus]|nr:hypothetical protein FHG87_014680 [Trinorchestia longiramus]
MLENRATYGVNSTEPGIATFYVYLYCSYSLKTDASGLSGSTRTWHLRFGRYTCRVSYLSVNGSHGTNLVSLSHTKLYYQTGNDTDVESVNLRVVCMVRNPN